MKSILRRIFAGKTLVDYAQGNNPQEFVDELVRTQVYLLGLAGQPGLDADSLNEDNLLAYIEEYSQFNDDDFTPMTLEYLGGDALLVFSTEKHREEFVGVFSREANRVFAFQTVTVGGDNLPALALNVSGVLLNPASDESHVLTSEQFGLLKNYKGVDSPPP